MCAGHSVSKGICGHKDVMQVSDWDAVAERQTVDVGGRGNQWVQGGLWFDVTERVRPSGLLSWRRGWSDVAEQMGMLVKNRAKRCTPEEPHPPLLLRYRAFVSSWLSLLKTARRSCKPKYSSSLFRAMNTSRSAGIRA